jgi:hypothetical protein
VEERSSKLILDTPPHFSGLTEETHVKLQYGLFIMFCVTLLSEG